MWSIPRLDTTSPWDEVEENHPRWKFLIHPAKLTPICHQFLLCQRRRKINTSNQLFQFFKIRSPEAGDPISSQPKAQKCKILQAVNSVPWDQSINKEIQKFTDSRARSICNGLSCLCSMKPCLRKNIPGLSLIPNTLKRFQIPKMQQLHFRMYKNHSEQMVPSWSQLKGAGWQASFLCIVIKKLYPNNFRTALLDAILNQSLQQITLSLNPTQATKCIRWPARPHPSLRSLFLRIQNQNCLPCFSWMCSMTDPFKARKKHQQWHRMHWSL